MKKACSKCGELKEETIHYRYDPRREKYRADCKVCCGKQTYKRHKERILEDEDYFWQNRARSINKPNSRRNGKARKAVEKKVPFLELKKLYNKDKSCTYCGLNLEKEDITFDHAMPLSRGGLNHIDNIRISCADCNQLKGKRNEREFEVFLKSYIKRINNKLSISI